MPKKVPRAGADQMSKNTTTLPKPGSNGSKSAGEKKENGNSLVAEAKEIIADKTEEKPDGKSYKPEKPVEAPVVEVVKEMTLQEKILKVENLALVIEKRSKLIQTRSELERFQTSSNDFNCTMRLNDSDGNVFTTSFTPGIKKVIDFLKTQFDASVADVEKKISF
jgi:hypothetical protein